MSRLTDEQCNEFRRSRGTFNDMVRKIYEAGRMAGAQEAAETMKIAYPRSGCYHLIENHFDFKLAE